MKIFCIFIHYSLRLYENISHFTGIKCIKFYCVYSTFCKNAAGPQKKGPQLFIEKVFFVLFSKTSGYSSELLFCFIA